MSFTSPEPLWLQFRFLTAIALVLLLVAILAIGSAIYTFARSFLQD